MVKPDNISMTIFINIFTYFIIYIYIISSIVSSIIFPPIIFNIFAPIYVISIYLEVIRCKRKKQINKRNHDSTIERQTK